MSPRRLRLAALALVSFLAPGAGAAPVLPEFSASNFAPGAAIDNRYYPLTPGTTYHYEARVTDPESGETVLQVDEDFVTRRAQTIARVQARIVHARAWEDGVLVEDTNDFFAQDREGNVWYLGEDTRAFEYDDEGRLVSTSTRGSWRAGVRGAKPGYIMPASPAVGFSHYQEFSPADQALDQAEIVSLTESITVPAGTFSNVLKTVEQSEAEPGVLENKYYAPGLGLILTEEDLDAEGNPATRIPLLNVTTGGTEIPTPPAAYAAMFAVSLAGAAGYARRAKKKLIG